MTALSSRERMDSLSSISPYDHEKRFSLLYAKNPEIQAKGRRHMTRQKWEPYATAPLHSRNFKFQEFFLINMIISCYDCEAVFVLQIVAM